LFDVALDETDVQLPGLLVRFLDQLVPGNAVRETEVIFNSDRARQLTSGSPTGHDQGV
jgi:hypothetical protein